MQVTAQSGIQCQHMIKHREPLERCMDGIIAALGRLKSRLKAKCARRRGESAVLFKNERRAGESEVARPRRACWARAAHQKHWFFIGERKNAHQAQARAHVSKCAPRTGESSILPTQDGAHDHVSKQKEHRTVARAPFPSKMCTARRREAQKCPSKTAEVLPLWRRAPYKSQFGPA